MGLCRQDAARRYCRAQNGEHERKRSQSVYQLALRAILPILCDTAGDCCLTNRAFCTGMEHRSEPRRSESLVVTINGIDKIGKAFKQNVVATRLSNSGALLSGITRPIRSGDVLWVQHGSRKSRFKVVWVRNSETPQLIQAAVHLMRTESCPWANI
jgi:hypothetical protein